MISEAVKLERERRKTAREERLAKVLTDPQVMGVLTLLAGLYAAQNIPWSQDETRNDLLRGVSTSAVIMAALGRAGISGWPAAAAVGLSGAAGAGAFDFLGASDTGTYLLGSDKRLFGIPIGLG